MKKAYCDKCGVEVDVSNKFHNGYVTVADVRFNVTIADVIPVDYDVCKYCVLDAIAALDDRPKGQP